MCTVFFFGVCKNVQGAKRKEKPQPYRTFLKALYLSFLQFKIKRTATICLL